MSATASPSSSQEAAWITTRNAAKLSGISVKKLQWLARVGAISVLRLPRSKNLLNRAEVEKLTAEFRHPARIA